LKLTLAPLVFVSLIGVGLCWLGCGGDDHAAVVPTATVPTSTIGPSDCSTASEGCACAVPGSWTECKKIRKVGDYISCSTGTITCGDDKKFGPCIGDSIWSPPEAGVDAKDAADAD
jgi:hypothetical protein